MYIVFLWVHQQCTQGQANRSEPNNYKATNLHSGSFETLNGYIVLTNLLHVVLSAG